MPGAFPNGKILKIKEYDPPLWVREIHHGAWGYVEYAEPLPLELAMQYDMIPGRNPAEN